MRKPYTIVFNTINGHEVCQRFSVIVDKSDATDDTAAIEAATRWYKKYHQMKIKSIEVIPIWDELKS